MKTSQLHKAAFFFFIIALILYIVAAPLRIVFLIMGGISELIALIITIYNWLRETTKYNEYDAMSMPVTKPKATKREVAFGVVVGAGCGLLFDSAITIWMGVGILYLVVFSWGLIYIVPIAFGVKLGTKAARKGMLPDISWILILASAIVIWPLAIYSPIGLSTLNLYSHGVREIPIYPGAEKVDTQIVPIPSEDFSPYITYVFQTDANAQSVLDFYRDELFNRGWEDGPINLRKHSFGGTPHWFQKKASIRIGSMSIKFKENDLGKIIQFEVTYYI